MRIQTNDGALFTGTAEAIVTQLREAAHLPTLTNAEYMTDVAQRVSLWNTTRISTASAGRFVEDLAKAKVIALLDAEET